MATLNKKISDFTSTSIVAPNDIFIIDQKQPNSTYITKSIKGSDLSNSIANTTQSQIDNINLELSNVSSNVSSLQIDVGIIQSTLVDMSNNISTNAISIISTDLIDQRNIPIANSNFYLKINVNGNEFALPLFYYYP